MIEIQNTGLYGFIGHEKGISLFKKETNFYFCEGETTVPKNLVSVGSTPSGFKKIIVHEKFVFCVLDQFEKFAYVYLRTDKYWLYDLQRVPSKTSNSGYALKKNYLFSPNFFIFEGLTLRLNAFHSDNSLDVLYNKNNKGKCFETLHLIH